MALLPSSWTKTGDDSKPTFVTQALMSTRRRCSARTLLISVSILAVLLSALLYYLYLSNLYLMDETYDYRGPKELLPIEKLTLRVHATNDIKDINRFVLHYSICPVVNEIQILWPHADRVPPHVEAFKYTTTHSKVRFVQLPSDSSVFQSYWVPTDAETEGIMVIDADVFIPCTDLRFAQTVWRSSYDGQVGYFPRLATTEDVQSASAVFWQGRYSLLLSSALIVSRSHLTELGHSTALQKVFDTHPECAPVMLSLFVVKKTEVGPIWVEGDVDVVHDVHLLTPAVRSPADLQGSKKMTLSYCTQTISQALSLTALPVSEFKATKAATHWTW